MSTLRAAAGAYAALSEAEINSKLDALLRPVNAGNGRALTAAEEREFVALKSALLIVNGETEMPEHLARQAAPRSRSSAGTAEERRAYLEKSQREIGRDLAPASPAPVRLQRVSLADHRRAMARADAHQRAILWHEAGHATLSALEGNDPTRVYLTYTSAMRIAGGFCHAPSKPFSAIAAVGGQVAARLFCDAKNKSFSESDSGHLERDLGHRLSETTRRQAERRASNLLWAHRFTVGAVAQALSESGYLEGAELDRLLAPVRAARRAA